MTEILQRSLTRRADYTQKHNANPDVTAGFV